MSKNTTKYYVVNIGRKCGIFTSWKECERRVKGYKNSRYKSYPTLEEAQEAYKDGDLYNKRPSAVKNKKFLGRKRFLF